jgi:soluble lytic murein transglycosylase
MSSMQKKALTLFVLLASAAAVGAQLAPDTRMHVRTEPVQPSRVIYPQYQQQPQQQQPAYAPPSAVSPRISSALERWRGLRQSDGFPFSSYASFLTSFRGWPGETAMRKSAEKAIDPITTRPGEVTSYFRMLPPLTASGHARHAAALIAEGDIAGAREAARRAWHGGVLPSADEERMLSLFGAALTQQDHDIRMETLLGNGDTQSAQRMLPLVSAARRPVYDARLALQTKAADAASRLSMVGSVASSDPGLLVDRANWLRNSGQSAAARSMLAQPLSLTARPHHAEGYLETLLVLAQGAANDRNWSTAYGIASNLDQAFAPGTDITQRTAGERDDYTSVAWLGGTTALHQLNRPADAMRMFVRYARAGRSAQVLTKGLYWAGRAAQAAGQNDLATNYFNEAASHPELFYGQLSLERVGRPVPAPASFVGMAPTDAERAAFEQRELVQATRALGLLGRWDDQSVFVRALAEAAGTQRDRMLAAELSRSIARPDLGVWVARTARNDGLPLYVRSAFPEVQIPAAQSQYWSLAHGVIRQESSFDRAAVSHAGARGMMQLMLPTARETAGKIGASYDAGRLTRDPDYNIMLGSAYFESLMSYWGGYAPLAVASYNAGPGNVRKWVRERGDPRLPHVDVVRWIEEIPFSETKGYVQRVLENAVVYDTMNPGRARSPERARLSYYLGKSGQPG